MNTEKYKKIHALFGSRSNSILYEMASFYYSKTVPFKSYHRTVTETHTEYGHINDDRGFDVTNSFEIWCLLTTNGLEFRYDYDNSEISVVFPDYTINLTKKTIGSYKLSDEELAKVYDKFYHHIDEVYKYYKEYLIEEERIQKERKLVAEQQRQREEERKEREQQKISDWINS